MQRADRLSAASLQQRDAAPSGAASDRPPTAAGLTSQPSSAATPRPTRGSAWNTALDGAGFRYFWHGTHGHTQYERPHDFDEELAERHEESRAGGREDTVETDVPASYHQYVACLVTRGETPLWRVVWMLFLSTCFVALQVRGSSRA